MAKDYLKDMVDLTGDAYLNPVPAVYDNGIHNRNTSSISSISIHHDATVRPHDYDSLARYRQEARDHYEKLGPGLQYHYKIDNTGTIFRVRPHETWLYVVGSQENMSTIAICLDGYFHPSADQKPTREQAEALSQLLVVLCEHHPEFPATYPDVRPHRDFSSTACCGDLLAPWIFSIKDNATATTIPSDLVYDWPELQPQPPVPTPPPAPVPDPQPEHIATFEPINPATYVAQVKTHLDQIDNHTTLTVVENYEPGTQFDMVRRMRWGNDTWLQTVYSVEHTPNRGVPEKDLLIRNTGTPTSFPTPSPVTPPVPPVAPIPTPEDQSHDYSRDNNSILHELREKIQEILEQISHVTPRGR